MTAIQKTVYGYIGLCLLTLLAGCETHQQSKNAVKEKYDQNAAPVKLSTAQVQFDQGLYPEARKTLAQVIEVESASAPAHCLLGKIELAEGRLLPARDAFGKALACDPNLAEAWFGSGVVAQSGGNHSLALDCYQKALTCDSGNIEYTLAVADTMNALGRSEDAQRCLDAQLAFNSKNVQLLCAAAATANRLGSRDKAIQLYRQATMAEPKNQEAMSSLATLYVAGGQWQNAADIYDKLLSVADDKQKEVYLHLLASCSLSAGQYRNALHAFDKLSVIRRNDPDVWLGMAQAALGASDLKRARYSAQKALSYKQDCPQAGAILGSADYLDKKYLSALERFTRLSGDPQVGGFACFMSGRCYLKMGRTEQAQAAFDKAVQVCPESPLAALFINQNTN
ncbi:MAG: tetratricopeptide repeat protein [Sedimentisphaerales bacterium]|nr:tetratricopeptide repeat protein [Sedimentisphaerales bacterium]